MNLDLLRPLVTIRALPMPPSVNSMYVNNQKTGGRFPSREAKLFKLECAATLKYTQLAPGVTLLLKARPLALSLEFFWPASKLTTKDGRPKRIDVSNRIKGIEDAICDGLDFDDSQFVRVHAVKRIDEHGMTFVNARIYDMTGVDVETA